MLLGINLSQIVHHYLFVCLPLLLLHPLVVLLGECQHLIDRTLIQHLMIFKILYHQPICLIMLVQVHEHLLFQFILPIVNDDAIVMLVESMYDCVDVGLVQMSNVGGRLLWLLS